MSEERVLWERQRKELLFVRALAQICYRAGSIVSDDPELWGDENSLEQWGVPAELITPIANLRSLGAALTFEWQQTYGVLGWGRDNPELACPDAPTRWTALVRDVNANAIAFMRALVPWMAKAEAEACAIDAATAAVVEGRATVAGDGAAWRVTVLEPIGAPV